MDVIRILFLLPCLWCGYLLIDSHILNYKSDEQLSRDYAEYKTRFLKESAIEFAREKYAEEVNKCQDFSNISNCIEAIDKEEIIRRTSYATKKSAELHGIPGEDGFRPNTIGQIIGFLFFGYLAAGRWKPTKESLEKS